MVVDDRVGRKPHRPEPGTPEEELETPCLVIERSTLLRNIARMADLAARSRVRLRAMTKSHKCIRLAKMQVAKGSDGITVAKLAEAEVMAAGGLGDILVSVPVVGPRKIGRLADLARTTRVTTVVDAREPAVRIAEAAYEADVEVGVLVEIDTGYGRCGVRSVPSGVELAEQVNDLAGLVFKGFMSYEGHIYRHLDRKTIEETAVRSYHKLADAAHRTRAAGIRVEVVSVGASATAEVAAEFEGVTEIRPGSYIFNDVGQIESGAAGPDDVALSVRTTVISRPEPARAIVDAGAKSLTHARATGRLGFGMVRGLPEAVVFQLSDEYGFIEPVPEEVETGDVLYVVPNSHTPVVDLFEHLVEVDGGVVTDVYDIDARGCRW